MRNWIVFSFVGSKIGKRKIRIRKEYHEYEANLWKSKPKNYKSTERFNRNGYFTIFLKTVIALFIGKIYHYNLTIISDWYRLQDRIDSYQTEIDRLKETNEELRQDMESCREREAELLNFTEKLTAKNVSLQSDYATLESKVMIVIARLRS